MAFKQAISKEQALVIRAIYNVRPTIKELAERYDVSESVIRRIINADGAYKGLDEYEKQVFKANSVSAAETIEPGEEAKPKSD